MQRAASEHDEAVDLLNGAGEHGTYAARQLSQLLRYKVPAQYDPDPISERDVTKAVELARRLFERAFHASGRK